jgi:hypothetical protein
LKEVSLPSTLESIGEGAFHDCYRLPEISIPDKVKNIGSRAFQKYCKNLKSITFSCKINEVTEGMFQGCSSLSSINIPNSVTSIGVNAFWNTGLTSVTIPGSVKETGNAAFGHFTKLTSVKLCEGVKTVSYDGFVYCYFLETVSFPASLEYVDSWAFEHYNNLKTIECNSTIPPAMVSNAFYNSNLTDVTLYVPRGSVDAYRNAPVWQDFPAIVAK